MKIFLSVIVFLSLSSGAFAQVITENPLDQVKARVEAVLSRAGVPITAAQNSALTLVMEEQRTASEQLFGDIMNFSRGPVQGAERDRALAGIQWMNDAFSVKLKDVLTDEQNRIWAEFLKSETRAQGGLPALRMILQDAGVPLDAGQEREAQAVYQEAASRLRVLNVESDTYAEQRAAVENEALGRVAELLTPPQQTALIAEFRRRDQ